MSIHLCICFHFLKRILPTSFQPWSEGWTISQKKCFLGDEHNVYKGCPLPLIIPQYPLSPMPSQQDCLSILKFEEFPTNKLINNLWRNPSMIIWLDTIMSSNYVMCYECTYKYYRKFRVQMFSFYHLIWHWHSSSFLLQLARWDW